MDRLEEYIYMIIRSHNEVNSSTEINKQRISTIFYLCDRASKRSPNASRISSVDYIKQYSGPVSGEIKSALSNGDQRHLFHKTDAGFIICNCPDHEEHVEVSEENLVNKITRKYASMEDGELRKYVLTLPELRSTKKYTTIDLSERSYSEGPDP